MCKSANMTTSPVALRITQSISHFGYDLHMVVWSPTNMFDCMSNNLKWYWTVQTTSNNLDLNFDDLHESWYIEYPSSNVPWLLLIIFQMFNWHWNYIWTTQSHSIKFDIFDLLWHSLIFICDTFHESPESLWTIYKLYECLWQPHNHFKHTWSTSNKFERTSNIIPMHWPVHCYHQTLVPSPCMYRHHMTSLSQQEQHIALLIGGHEKYFWYFRLLKGNTRLPTWQCLGYSIIHISWPISHCI